MSLYAQYLRERTKDEIIETEQGFATYRFTDEKSCYIIDIYTIPDFRKQGAARDIADKVMEIAREKGCTRLYGSVVPSANGSTESVKVLLAYGMSVDSCSNDFIIFRKDI